MAQARLPALLQCRSLLQSPGGVGGLQGIFEQCTHALPIACRIEAQGGTGCSLMTRLVNSMSTSASVHGLTPVEQPSTSAAKPNRMDTEGSRSDQLRRASAQQASTSSRSHGTSHRPEASRKPRFPFDGKRKPPSLRPSAGGPAPEVAAKQDWPQQVTRVGKVAGRFEVPRKPVFAVVELGPTQFKVRLCWGLLLHFWVPEIINFCLQYMQTDHGHNAGLPW